MCSPFLAAPHLNFSITYVSVSWVEFQMEEGLNKVTR